MTCSIWLVEPSRWLELTRLYRISISCVCLFSFGVNSTRPVVSGTFIGASSAFTVAFTGGSPVVASGVRGGDTSTCQVSFLLVRLTWKLLKKLTPKMRVWFKLGTTRTGSVSRRSFTLIGSWTSPVIKCLLSLAVVTSKFSGTAYPVDRGNSPFVAPHV
jgi:hypothetical protein